MKQIGIIVAVEIQSVLDKYGCEWLEQTERAGYRILIYKTAQYQMVLINCGAGEIAAASATQFLISEYHVDMVLNFGVVGGLTEEMTKTKVCIIEKVVHYDFDTSAADHTEIGRYLNYPDIYIPTSTELFNMAVKMNPTLTPVICASGDKFIVSAEQKSKLHKQFGADICEMEAAGIVLTCNRNKVPCMLIKIVSDSIRGGYEEFKATKDTAASMCLEILDQIINEI